LTASGMTCASCMTHKRKRRLPGASRIVAFTLRPRSQGRGVSSRTPVGACRQQPRPVRRNKSSRQNQFRLPNCCQATGCCRQLRHRYGHESSSWQNIRISVPVIRAVGVTGFRRSLPTSMKMFAGDRPGQHLQKPPWGVVRSAWRPIPWFWSSHRVLVLAVRLRRKPRPVRRRTNRVRPACRVYDSPRHGRNIGRLFMICGPCPVRLKTVCGYAHT
jgi:hypothetical protein